MVKPTISHETLSDCLRRNGVLEGLADSTLIGFPPQTEDPLVYVLYSLTHTRPRENLCRLMIGELEGVIIKPFDLSLTDNEINARYLQAQQDACRAHPSVSYKT